MALQSALTVGQLNAIRSGKYQALQFVCVVPNEVVVQFQPSVAPSTSVYAEITVGIVAQGDMANIKQGQTVIFSTTADYQATEVFRTRVRKVSGTSTLYVGENSQSLTTADYVTVLNTYEIQEKLRKSETLADWDITFRKLLPIETALPSAVVLSNGVTTYSPTAAPKAMDASATSTFTHAWESSNSNDTLDSGGTTNNPSFTLQAASFRWIRYTFTDSNGNSNFRVIPVWTVPKDYSNPYVITGFVGESGDVADIAHDAELGWSATVTAWDGIEDLINKTYVVIASDEWYDDTRQNIRTNIDFVGFLQNENTGTRGDEVIGRSSETTFAVESFGHQLARQNISNVTIIQVSAAASAWNQIQNPTPGRMLTYHLTEHSTIFHLCSMTIPTDDTNFIGDDLTLAAGKALDDAQIIASVINAEVQFDTDGRMDLCRNLNFQGSVARDAAPVAATLTPADVLDYAIEYEYAPTTSMMIMTGGAYSTATDSYRLFEAYAPAVARLGEGDPLEDARQVLTTDSTIAEANAEIEQRVSNYFAYNNPAPTMRVILKDEWHFITPDIGSWFKFSVAPTDTARGRTFGTNDRWQCVERTVSTNNETGRRQVTAALRHETQSTGAIVRARQIQNDSNADIIYFPPALPPFAGGDLDLTGGEWWDSMDSAPPSEPDPTDANCENGGLRVRTDQEYETTATATTNQEVQITVRGSGQISNGNYYVYTKNFREDNGGWLPFNYNGVDIGVYTPGQGFTHTDDTNAGYLVRGVAVRLLVPSAVHNFKFLTINYSWEGGTFEGDFSQNYALMFRGSTFGPMVSRTNLTITPGNNQVLVHEIPDPGLYIFNGTSVDIVAFCSSDNVFPLTVGGSLTIHSITLGGFGTNPFPEEDSIAAEPIFGDAFYMFNDTMTPRTYPGGKGLLIEGVQPPSIPPFDPSHEYPLDPFEVNSGTVDYEYVNLYPLAELENFSIQVQTCFL